ncbi:hypothetical protein B0H14DRAFT_2613400 [Mycena olivaceomarginata]|nr:hypothetical protein B0H14DRAFT_2613400 [Mycena olivaceomarginata]
MPNVGHLRLATYHDHLHSETQAISENQEASEQRRKRHQALQQYAERNAETLREKAKERMRRLRAAHAAQNKSSDRSLADFDYRERKYIENYGGRSYHQFYYPLLEFFGEGNLAGVTIIDETKHRRSKKFSWRLQKSMRMQSG